LESAKKKARLHILWEVATVQYSDPNFESSLQNRCDRDFRPFFSRHVTSRITHAPSAPGLCTRPGRVHRGHCSSIDGVLAYINVPPSNLGFQIKKDVRTPDRSTPALQSE
jgi:hypothetical protein